MNLNLDDRYRIVSDEYNFILQKRTDPSRGPNTRKGKKLNKTGGWKDVGYWKDLGQLLLSYSGQKLRASGVANMEEVYRLLETLRVEIRAIGKQCVTFWGKTPGEKEDSKDCHHIHSGTGGGRGEER
ncbi:MAG: hypothetical protein IH937_12100 [Acidobacteria bacterium]|nr:hypothetical protein [Acidobacteriota bacterium]